MPAHSVSESYLGTQRAVGQEPRIDNCASVVG